MPSTRQIGGGAGGGGANPALPGRFQFNTLFGEGVPARYKPTTQGVGSLIEMDAGGRVLFHKGTTATGGAALNIGIATVAGPGFGPGMTLSTHAGMPGASGNCTAYIACGYAIDATGLYTPAEKAFGFRLTQATGVNSNNTELRGFCSDGTTETVTAVIAPNALVAPLADIVRPMVAHYRAGGIDFYVDKILRASITTGLPVAAASTFELTAGIKGASGALNDQVYIQSLGLSYEVI